MMYQTIPPAVVPAKIPRLRRQGMRGLGQLFDSTDVQDWGWPEWLVIAAVGWFAYSFLRGARNTGRRVVGAVRKRRRRKQLQGA